jgi:hypothetical protein
MYQGGYFKATLRYALSITTPDNVRILSSKYGLLKLTDVIEPYEMVITDAAVVTNAKLKEQATAQGLIGASIVYIVAGKRYDEKLRTVFPNAKNLLQGVGGMGKQIQYLNNRQGVI